MINPACVTEHFFESLCWPLLAIVDAAHGVAQTQEPKTFLLKGNNTNYFAAKTQD